MSHSWHYAKGGEKHGPITAAQLKELASTGQLLPDDLVWREDMKEWRKASTVKGLFPEQIAVSPPPPPTNKANSVDELPLWERPAILALLVICCFPLGLFLLWKTPRIGKHQKILWTGAFAGLVVLGMIASNSQPKATVTQDGHTHIESPELPSERTHYVTWDEINKVTSEQQRVYHTVAHINDIDFTQGPHGEAIESYRVRNDSGDDIVLSASFYRDHESGEPILHGPFIQYSEAGIQTHDYIMAWGVAKTHSQWREDGYPKRIDIYNGDKEYRRYLFTYGRRSPPPYARTSSEQVQRFMDSKESWYLLSMTSYSVELFAGDNGQQREFSKKDGLMFMLNERGEIQSKTLWRDKEKVAVWADGGSVSIGSFSSANPNDKAVFQREHKEIQRGGR